MNTKIQLSFLLTFSLFLHSCCTKMDCFGIDDLNRIELNNFEDFALSEINFYTYSNGSYTTVIDSTSLIAYGTTLTNYVDLEETMVEGGYYKISFADNTSYTIQDIKGEKKRCNKGFMCRDFYQQLDSYKINNVVEEYYSIRIVR